MAGFVRERRRAMYKYDGSLRWRLVKLAPTLSESSLTQANVFTQLGN
jgi:hypothetical protein